MTIEAQDSNDSGLAIAEEASIGVLPAVPDWYGVEVNSYADFGGDPTLVTRKIIGTRKPQKGSITGIAPKGGYNSDFTASNFARQLQGFTFSSVREKTTSAPMNAAGNAITAVANADDSYAAAAGLGAFLVGALILASGFTNAANNGLKNVATVAAGKVTVTQVLTDEAAPPAAAKIEAVGFEFDAGDATLTYAGGGGAFTLGTTATDLTTLGLIVGEWIYIGGDGAAYNFVTANLYGYARIKSIAAHAIVFDKFTGTPATDAGAGKTIQIFFGSVYKDEDSATSVRRTYTQERQLGNDADGIQTEQLIGCVANELTFNAPKKDKLTVDLAYVALDAKQFAGAVGLAAGNRHAAPGEDAYNTSSDVFRMRLSVFDGTTLLPTGFGYVTSANLKINNNATINEAVGKVGGFEVNVGDFDVTGSTEAYFTTISSIQAVRNKSTCSFDMIVGALNTAWIMDVPSLELSGGLAKIEKNKPIMLPLNTNGVQNSNGYVVLFNRFAYAPTQAMPSNDVQV